MSEVDWSAELRRIERQFDGLPPEPNAEALRARRISQELQVKQDRERSARIGTGLRLVLVASLAGALAAWPYERSCGLGLYAWLGAQGTVALGGLWVSVHSWRNRMAKTHAIALAIALAGIALVAAEALPRTGYASVRAPGWECR